MSHESTDSEAVTLEQDGERAIEVVHIAALLDGSIYEFGFRGLRVRRCGASIEVTTQNGERLGGCFLADPAAVASVHSWLETKADYYGSN